MRTIHFSQNFYSSNKTVRATVLGGLWALEWAWHFAETNLRCVRSSEICTNYKGITKLSAIHKTFARHITSQLQHLCSSLISPCQHGFVKRRSTTTNLLELTSFVTDGFNKKWQTDVIYKDFSKAIDSVNHSLFLFKLDQLGSTNNLLTWISSCLNGRSQKVLFKNAVSKMINATSGVPQGSHLGPLLFTLFINDLPSIVTHSRVLMYADDVKLCLSYNNIGLLSSEHVPGPNVPSKRFRCSPRS